MLQLFCLGDKMKKQKFWKRKFLDNEATYVLKLVAQNGFIPNTHRVDARDNTSKSSIFAHKGWVGGCHLNSKCSFTMHTGWMWDVLLPSDHSLHTEGECMIYYFLVLIHYTQRVDVWYLTSQCSFTSHTGWMCDVLLPSVHSLHTQGGCVMSYFPVIIHYTHRVDVWCLTSQCSFPTHTGWMCDDLLPSVHSLHTQGGCVMSYFPVLISKLEWLALKSHLMLSIFWIDFKLSM